MEINDLNNFHQVAVCKGFMKPRGQNVKEFLKPCLFYQIDATGQLLRKTLISSHHTGMHYY